MPVHMRFIPPPPPHTHTHTHRHTHTSVPFSTKVILLLTCILITGCHFFEALKRLSMYYLFLTLRISTYSTTLLHPKKYLGHRSLKQTKDMITCKKKKILKYNKIFQLYHLYPFYEIKFEIVFIPLNFIG